MSEKPLHVRVAEALGWTHCYRKTEYTDFEPIETTENWRGFPPSRAVVLSGGVSLVKVPRYDTDWYATGPMIEKYGIDMWMTVPGDFGVDGFNWAAQPSADARSPQPQIPPHVGRTPLVAICHLILALSKAGKL